MSEPLLGAWKVLSSNPWPLQWRGSNGRQWDPGRVVLRQPVAVGGGEQVASVALVQFSGGSS